MDRRRRRGPLPGIEGVELWATSGSPTLYGLDLEGETVVRVTIPYPAPFEERDLGALDVGPDGRVHVLAGRSRTVV